VNFKFLFSTIVVLGLLSSEVGATTTTVNTNAHVGTYNLILKDDYKNQNGGHVHGSSLVGGDWTTSVDQPVGHELTGTDPVDAVTVLGEINGGGNLKVLNGNNIVYGSLNGATVSLDGTGGTSTLISDLANTSAPSDTFTSVWNQVVADSAYFKSLDETGILNTSTPTGNNGMKFQNDNSLALNVFNIDTTNLVSNGGFDFDVTPTAPVVINVSGTGTINITSKALGNMTSPAAASNILWNFFEADVINFSNGSWYGSVLAPSAAVNLTGGNLEGGLAAFSLLADRELHNALYSYTPPTTTPPSEVPAPAGLALIGLALVFMVRRKLTK
jgi:choice-of-anchor A domain-containing protein